NAFVVITSSFFPDSAAPRDLHSFPTRRSSDLHLLERAVGVVGGEQACEPEQARKQRRDPDDAGGDRAQQFDVGTHGEREQARHQDRKSTRLNSSHVKISYAVFCLKKKKTK